MQRHATSEWNGDLKSGKGSVKVGSGAFAGPYSFISRFEGSKDTNPEELLASAVAGCYAITFGVIAAHSTPTSTRAAPPKTRADIPARCAGSFPKAPIESSSGRAATSTGACQPRAARAQKRSQRRRSPMMAARSRVALVM